MKKISVLGSTGSIGTQTLEVVKNINSASECENDRVEISAITANENIELFEKQIIDFKPEIAAVFNEERALELEKKIKQRKLKTEILKGYEGIKEAAKIASADTVVNALVGKAGLEPTVCALRAGKNVALANKETLVAGGEIVMREATLNNVAILPVDSEHSAIFQCLRGADGNKINKIHLTASGGPFRGMKDLTGITVKDALKHPNWSMGKKVTIDSATLMNKGLEAIEAKWLFDVKLDKINVVVHPQSIIHSMIEFEDGSVIAQLGSPDMKLPIQYALTYPKRVRSNFRKIDFFSCGDLTFEKPDMNVFKCLGLAFDAINVGGDMPAVLNAANEIAVSAFIYEKITFNDISVLIEKAMNAYNVNYNCSLEDIFSADLWAREFTQKQILMR